MHPKIVSFLNNSPTPYRRPNSFNNLRDAVVNNEVIFCFFGPLLVVEIFSSKSNLKNIQLLLKLLKEQNQLKVNGYKLQRGSGH